MSSPAFCLAACLLHIYMRRRPAEIHDLGISFIITLRNGYCCVLCGLSRLDHRACLSVANDPDLAGVCALRVVLPRLQGAIQGLLAGVACPVHIDGIGGVVDELDVD